MIKQLKNGTGYWVLSILIASFAIAMPSSAFGQMQSSMLYNKTITVYGEATITTKPDVVYFPMDITTTAPIINDAYEENQIKIENTLKKLKELGISSKQIKVLDSQLYKREAYNVGEAPIFGISNIVVATINNIDKMKSEKLRKKIFDISQAISRTTITPYAGTMSPGIGRLSSELSASMAYYGNCPMAVFGLTNHEELQEKALLQAIENAKKEAERLAKILGVELKEMIYFYQTYPYAGGCGPAGCKDEILPKGPKSDSPESIKIYVSVNIVYSFE